MVGAADSFRPLEPSALECVLTIAPASAPASEELLADAPVLPEAAGAGLGCLIGRFGVPGMGEIALPSDRVLMGRDPACNVVLTGGSVSPVHAEIALNDGVWWFNDLTSAEGSWVDGEPVTGPTPLAPGSILRLGQAVLVFDPRDLWTESASPSPLLPEGPILVSWPSRDEPMAPTFEWPAHTTRSRWPLYVVTVLVLSAIIALYLRAA